MIPKKDVVKIPSDLAYKIASSVMDQGYHCDALAFEIKLQLDTWLNDLAEEAYEKLEKRFKE